MKSFKCQNCGKEVKSEAIGTKNRNHCPFCLHSKHVDTEIGDRLSSCGGNMKPLGLTSKKDGELMLIHECEKCGKISANRIAGDDKVESILELFGNSCKKKKELEKGRGFKIFSNRDKLEKVLFGK